jgi:hypothetical protein
MTKVSNDDLKLIYVHKIGINSKNENLFEFIFSDDDTNIDNEGWGWDIKPACDNALQPTKEYISKILPVKIKSFNLWCLQESIDCEYMHGYHNIHALAYEIENENIDGFDDYNTLLNNDDDMPLMVFHYGMSLSKVIEMFESRKFTKIKNELIESSSYDVDDE